MTKADTGDKLAVDVDTGYKLAVKVLIPLNHDRYKSYFTQFIVLHFGLFTLMNKDLLPNSPIEVPFLCIVGIVVSYIWWLKLKKIRADIAELWRRIKNHEDERYKDKKYKNIKSALIIKTNESRAEVDESGRKVFSSGRLMMWIPKLIGVVYFVIFVGSIVAIIQKMSCPCNP